MSCNSMDQASYPSSGTLSISSSEAAFSFSMNMEGYDHDFVPHPEPRYECPICLLVLREPRQTRCGHRFCRDCILRSLRHSSNRCPVDNEPLTENDIYPDNFAKREILNFNIKCPNKKDGCGQIFPLGKLQNHLDECPYALMPCPYKCACIMQRIDVDEHLLNSCENRVVICEHCHNNIQAKFMQNHLAACPDVVVACPHCKEPKFRKELNFHIQSECQLVEVHCPFYLIGCNHRMVRSSVDDHLMHAGSSHMKQLCHAVTCLAQKVGMTHLINDAPSNDLPETLSCGHHDCSPVSLMATWSPGQAPVYPLSISTSEASVSSETVLAQMQPLRFEHGSGEVSNTPVNSGQTSASFHDGQHRITSTQYQSPDAAYRLPSGFLADSDMDQTRRSSPSSQIPRAKLPVRRLNYQPVYSTPTSDVVSPQSKSPGHSFQDQMAEMSDQANMNVIRTIQEMNSRFEAREALQQQKFYELHSKLTTVEQVNADLVKKVNDLEQLLTEKDARFYNGDFYWSIGHFSHYRTKLAAGESTMLHSPPFYTNPWGYKMCVRANIEKSQDTGSNFSLFVHFMKGRNDSFLTWPFSGKITICVVDQNPEPSRRVHIKETLKANPNLAAFQRPTAPRNHKGFGYIDFLSIAAIENGTFLVDDTLVIRVQVFDDSK